MGSKITFNKFALGYSISSFLITFGAMNLFQSIPTKLFIAGVYGIEVVFYLGIISLLSFILALLAPLLGSISDKRIHVSRRRPFLIFGILGMALVTVLYYFSPLDFGINDSFLNIIFFVSLQGIYVFSSLTFSITFDSLYPEIFQNLNSRSTVIALLIGFSALSSIIRAILERFFYIEIIYTGIIFSLLVILGGIVLFKRGFDEPYLRILKKPKSNEHSSYKILSSSNKLFKWFLISFFIITFSEILITNALSYNWSANIVSIPLSLYEFTTFLLDIIPSVFIIAFVFYWRKLSLSIGIKKLLKILIITLSLISIVFLFLFDFVSGIIFTTLIKLSLSGLNFVKLLLLAIIIDHYFLNTGKRREATYFGLNHTFNFVSGYIGLLLMSFITVFSVLFVNPFDPIQTYFLFSKIGLSLFALLFLGISLILIRKIPLDRETYNKIEEEIAEINA
ncbi:MAG: MFS transporter [Candidatus Lokiarchaeota archaeon]|nr:MFS transporter [Candidatus Lokiarchaeota archaeon]